MTFVASLLKQVNRALAMMENWISKYDDALMEYAPETQSGCISVPLLQPELFEIFFRLVKAELGPSSGTEKAVC
jgi:hypothetical protein